MKIRTAFLVILMTFSLSLWAQRADQIIANVSQAINQQHWDEASNLFRLAVSKDCVLAEQFFQKEITLNCPARMEMIKHLADYYKFTRDYEKSYDYYKELVQPSQKNCQILTSCAEVQVILDKEEDALHTYEKVLAIDGNNLPANIFLGNYYYFSAEKERQQLEKDYKKLNPPTKMQYAHYRNELNRLIVSEFGKAKIYLERVAQLFPSVEAKKTLNKIKNIEISANQ